MRLCIFLFLFPVLLSGQDLLQSGPMVGYSEMREVLLWVQTTEAADVHIEYRSKNTPTLQTATVRTEREHGYIAKLIADEVQPGLTYQYEVCINGKRVKRDYPMEFQSQALWMWRTDPPPFRMALGSCTYVNEEQYDRPGNGYGGGYDIFKSIDRANPDLMLWMGDNMYLREADWYTRTGYYHRYTHTRSLPEMQPLLARTHHYAVWDDHDYGPNNSDGTWIHKDLAVQTFADFWGNPTYGMQDVGGIFSRFQWADTEFFLLDNRYHRTPNESKDCDCTILGEQQLDWLINSLTGSLASFKFVVLGGQVLNPARVYETYMNLCPKERQYLLGKIELEGIKNVIFLDGDRHHTELSHYTNNRGNAVYDLTVSPTTAGSGGNREEPNALRVKDTMVNQRNFATIDVSGKFRERTLVIRVYDSAGKELWDYEIEQQK